MATNEVSSEFSVASVVEDVLQNHGKALSDVDLASRKANEASVRRYEATGWLRKMVGVVWSKNLPAQPSEEEFRLGLRSGIILCNVLNKIQPGSVPKIVAPVDTVIIPDGAALSTFQYFENVRNFLVAIEGLGIPKFEICDLEKGGKSARIVNSVLALKSYSEWKEKGGQGQWKFGGNLKPSPSGHNLLRKNSEPFMGSLAKSLSMEKCFDTMSCGGDLGQDVIDMGDSRPLHVIVREFLSDKRQDEVPIIVENMLSKVTEEFESRLEAHVEELKKSMKDTDASCTNKSIAIPASGETKMEGTASSQLVKEDHDNKKDLSADKDELPGDKKDIPDAKRDVPDAKKDVPDDKREKHSEAIKAQNLKQQKLVEQHHKDLQVLKNTVSTARADMQLLQMKYQEEVNSLGKHLQTLVHAASGYQKVLEENRKLYNQVQDLKGSIRVYCRVRPFLPGEQDNLSAISHVGDGKITIITPSKYGKEGRKSFTFNQAFGPSATQEEVFSDMRPLVRSVLDGYNVCIFAYGQTGSGKTYTMSGPNDPTEETLGVNYRALGDLFLISEERKNAICYEVLVQMIEIYNEQVRDLLVTDGLNKKLEIRNSSQKGINVPDANLVPVSSTADVINLMNIGQKNRAVGSTAMNDRSSRSHSCLTVHIQGRDLTSGAVIRGCMHLVDLAGSERADKTEAVGDRLKEAQHINKSLSALGDVIASLAQKNAHVPYRNSKLTQLLQDSLGGQAKTLMFVHISPDNDAIGETISTLKFAERVSTVELGAARANKDSGDVKELKEQIANLKAALAKKEAENIQQSKLVRMMSAGSSYPSPTPSWESVGDSSNYSREPDEFVDAKDINIKQGQQGFEVPQIIMPSPPWQTTPITSPHLNGREGSGKWVDKVMLNKQNSGRKDDTPTGKQWSKVGQSPNMSPQRYPRDAAKVYPEQPVNKGFTNKNDSSDHEMNRTRYEATTTDESDAAASDCSEPDVPWQPSIPKPTNIPTATGSKLKKPTPRNAKSQETRSAIPQPSPRRLSNGPGSRSGRQTTSGDGKRRTGSGK